MKGKRHRRVHSKARAAARRWWLLAALLISGGVVGIFFFALGKVPLPEAAPVAQSSVILSKDGDIIGTLHGEENRTIVPLKDISMNLREAVIATEDRNFYKHSGVSFRGIFRAAVTNVKGKELQQGGSTITQQYVRAAIPEVGRERTIFRKIKEATLAVKLERRFTKDKILEFYLNTVYFGRGSYGAEGAARTYFKKSAKDLTLSESAYLAGVIRAPEKFQIDRAPDAATRIRNEVLNDMIDAGYIEADEATKSKGDQLKDAFKPGASIEQDSPRGAYFVEFVRRWLRDELNLTDAELLGGGLRVQTTLDMRMQDAAEAAIRSTFDKPADPEAALVAIDIEGRLLAMVGGRDTQDLKRARGSNFAANFSSTDSTGRQAGSAFKPFALAAFVEAGKSVESVFPAPANLEITSRQCKSKKGENWNVSNFENSSFGPSKVTDATVRSVNTVYAQMADIVTPRRMGTMIENAGVPLGKGERVCALALGTSPVTPLEMARGYATFAARGKRPEIVFVTKVLDASGKTVQEASVSSEQTVDENVADTVNFALEENIRRGTGTGAKIGRPAAGKTGTTQNHADAWFAGYTTDIVAVVWNGFAPDETGKIPEMVNVRGKKVTGGSFPATIWRKFMVEAVKGYKVKDFAAPSIGGEVVHPSPTPCPSPGPTAFNCSTTPSPSPSPSPSTIVLPPCPPSVPGPSPSPSPAPPSPTPKPSPTCKP